jgi:hypothetical protein
MRRSRRTVAPTAIALTALATAVPAPQASADATLKVPNGDAACIAQAWVPYNTDPEVEAGALGGFLSTDPPTHGRLSQNQYRDDCGD